MVLVTLTSSMACNILMKTCNRECLTLTCPDLCLLEIHLAKQNHRTESLNKYHNKTWKYEINRILLLHVLEHQTTFSFTEHLLCYTPLPVDICAHSWKAIEVMVAVSELTMSLAWYSRTPRTRHGPSTNICTIQKCWRIPALIWISREVSSYIKK
jgi:hypothetical protein